VIIIRQNSTRRVFLLTAAHKI